MSDAAHPAGRGWIALVESVSVGAATCELLSAADRFQRMQVVPALVVAALAAAVAGGGSWRGFLRGLLLFPLLVAAVLFVPLGVVLEPWVTPFGLIGAGLLAAASRTKSKLRPALLAGALIGLFYFTVSPSPALSPTASRFVPAMLALVVVSGVIWRRPAVPLRLAPLLVLTLVLATLPALSVRMPPCNERLHNEVISQRVAESLFDNATSLEIPAARNELLCDQTTGIRVVTPHYPSTRVGVLAPGQPPASVVLFGEASEQSVVCDGVLYTAAKGSLNALDLRIGHNQVGPRLAQNNLGRLQYGADGDLLAGVENHGGFCHLARRDTLAGAGHVPLLTPGACVPAGPDLLLVSSFGWPGRRITLHRISDGRVLAERNLIDIGFLDVTVDVPRRLVYAPSTLFGLVRVLDLATLRPLRTFRSEPGVRGVLLDPSGTRLFTYTYTDGRIIEHELPSGRVLRSVIVGGPLRGLTWDCDGQALLATTCLGGFRVRL